MKAVTDALVLAFGIGLGLTLGVAGYYAINLSLTYYLFGGQ